MDFDKKDYYGVLGVSPNAEDFLIKAAYKALAQRYHPDKHESNQSGDKFKAINEAYSILSDVHKRQQYDDYLKKKNSNPLNQNQAQPEEQNTNDINQNNEDLAVAITTLILSAVLTIVSVFAVLFVSVISSTRNLYQKFTAYSDENAKHRQHEESKQREENLKRKQHEENLKSKQCEEELKRKHDEKSKSGGYGWIIWFLVFAIPIFGVLSLNKEAAMPLPVAIAPIKPTPVGAEPLPSLSQPESVEPVVSVSVPQETITFPNGDKYIGEVKNGKPERQGTYFTAAGITATGEFKNGLLEGQGTITTPEGNKYEVEFKSNQPDEQGKITYVNGNKYEGKWKNGTPEGQGVFSYANGSKYEGKFKNGLLEGQGTATFPDGGRYEGKFKKGLFNGQGIATFANGQQYTGKWKMGKPASYQSSQAPTEVQPRRLTEEQTFAQARKELEDQEAQEQARLDAQIKELEEKRIHAKARESGEADAQTRKQADEEQARAVTESLAEDERNKKYMLDKEQREKR